MKGFCLLTNYVSQPTKMYLIQLFSLYNLKHATTTKSSGLDILRVKILRPQS